MMAGWPQRRRGSREGGPAFPRPRSLGSSSVFANCWRKSHCRLIVPPELRGC